MLAAFIAFSLHQERAAIEVRERERLVTQGRVIHDNFVRQLDGVNRALVSVRDDLPAWRQRPDGLRQASQRLRAFSDALPGVRTMTVLDADGLVIASSRPELLGNRFPNRPYFQMVQRAPDLDTFYVSPPFKTSLGAWGINVVRMLPGARGEFAGIASATLDPEAFTILLESVRYADDMRVGLNHGDGEVFLTAPAREDLYGKNLARPGSFYSQHIASGREENVFSGIMYSTQEKRIAALRTIRPADLKMNKPLMIAISRDIDAIFSNWRDKAKWSALLFGLLALSSSMGLALFQYRRRLADEEANQAAIALREKTAEVDRFFAVSLDLLAIASLDGRFIRLNPAWERTLGYSLAELEGVRFLDLVHPDDKEATLAAVENLASGETVVNFINRYRSKQGEYRYIEWHSVAVPGTELIYGAARDITERHQTQETLRALNAKLQAQAYVDGLTGVANRRRFDEDFFAECRRCRREKVPLAVLMIDIDHFKRFNDHYGHQAGDEALKAVATALHENMGRPSDLIARYGGEEFVCLLPDCNLDGAHAIAEKLRLAVTGLGIPHELSSVSETVSISLGVAAHIPAGDEDADKLLAAADKALYLAKRSGRNQVRLEEAAEPPAQ
ncbi:MAG TPA: diguanylate cyclase [Azospira sp.]|nr:diguanylate cyclase [Azospira sp.]